MTYPVLLSLQTYTEVRAARTLVKAVMKCVCDTVRQFRVLHTNV